MRRLAALALLTGLCCWAQSPLTVDQLISFVTSSIKLKQPDRQAADYLRTVRLRYKLDESTIAELQAAGAGPRTMEALRALQESSKLLPARPSVAPPAAQEASEIPPPAPSEWKPLLDQARDYALSYTRRLPDFLCTQVTRRYIDPAGLEVWEQQDTLTARLSYFEQQENYQLMLVNGKATDASYMDVGGAISSGEFGSMMREIFDRQTAATFQWERWATLRGRRMQVFAYRVAQPSSKWSVEYEKRDRIVPGYHGLVFVDNEAGVVTRITLEADDIPPSFPLQQVSSSLDYDYATIAGQEYMLPLKAVMRMRQGKLLVKNEVEFRVYRKFSTETSITYDTPDPLPVDKTTEQPPKR
jgi:hypothetical protein